ncbi:MAG: TlpA disulfide reductase family protein [Acidobacteria bacterium]|nr:TlpA disulfide reductase family protein [Acidobacteriota bacterium]
MPPTAHMNGKPPRQLTVLPATLAATAALLLTDACTHPIEEDSQSPEDFITAAFADIGPDWGVVQKFLDWHQASTADDHETSRPDPSEDPSIQPAVAAARAIIDQNGNHEKTVEAAQFLANLLSFQEAAVFIPGNDRHVDAGARALLAHAPHYEEWPQVLLQIHRVGELIARIRSTPPATHGFLQKAASEASDPVLQSAARYFLADELMRSANDLSLSPEHREDRRRRALTMATGLMWGVEREEFLVPAFGDSTSRTFADAEADLVHRIHHATVGGTLPDLTGTRFDGVHESLNAYQGRVLLLDFWATWCGPCLAALPDLRELVARLPADRFALLAISVDADLETATAFFKEDHVIELLNKQPVPWANWYAGVGSAIQWRLAVDAFPTYVLADHGGRILARTHELSEEFIALIDEAVRAIETG